jgi:hypothetical protein
MAQLQNRRKRGRFSLATTIVHRESIPDFGAKLFADQVCLRVHAMSRCRSLSGIMSEIATTFSNSRAPNT